MAAALLVALALPGHAWGSGGPGYQAAATTSPPTIDGTITPSEWADATAYSLNFGSIPATVRFEHTATDLYVGVTVQDLAPGTTPSLSVYFDNNHDGIKDQGDDAWIDFTGASGEDFFYDAGVNSHTNDLGAGGSDDTTAAGTNASGAVTFEFSHPLCSADTAHDICATVGQTLGVDFQYEPGTAPGVFYDAPGSNTFDPSLGWGDLLLASAAGDTTPPTVTLTQPAAGSVLSGTVDVAADASDNVGVASVRFRYFDGTRYTELGTDTTSPYTTTFDTTTVADTTAGSVYAIATDTSGNTTSYANDVSIHNGTGGGGGGGASGSLSGSLAYGSGATNQDLTALGSEDWAVWGYANGGISTSLAPDVRKASGSGISDLQDIDPTGAPLRGLGNQVEPFSFDWSDGGGIPSASGATAGLQHDGQQTSVTTLGDGFSFTVPADTTSRTLTIWVTTNRAEGQLTASLSDGSAADFTSTLPLAADTQPGIYTITYNAASAGQTLLVKWVESLDNCSTAGHCDNAAIYAVALTGPPPAASPPVSTVAPAVEGQAQVGFDLSSDTGSWDSTVTGVAYQWQSSTDGGSSWTSIAGATGSTYRVHVAQSGEMVRSAVTATNAGGSTTAYSTPLSIAALPANGALAWSQFNTTTDQYEIWGANPGGAPSLIFGASNYENKQPSFSPDGSQIAFTSAQTVSPSGGHVDAIATMPLDGSASPLVLASDSVGDQWPAWSPDGTTIAYIQTDSGGLDGTGSLWAVDAPGNGSSSRIIISSNTEEHFTQPSWSPDGTQLAVVSEASPASGFAGESTIDLVDAGTGFLTAVVGPTPGLRHPRFSADGTVLYYDISTSGTAATLHAVSLENGADLSPPSGTADRQLVPAPDGHAVALLQNGDVVTGHDISLGTSQDLVNISNIGLAADPAWGTGTLALSQGLDTKLVSGPTFPAPAGSGVVSIEFAAVGPPSAVLQCSVDDLDAAPCSTSYTFDPGTSHTIEAQAVDGTSVDATPVVVHFFVPANSANGDIAFESQRNGGFFHVWKVKPTGGTPVQLTSAPSPYTDEEPSWSPDGASIAFDGTSDTVPHGLYTVDANGSNRHALATNGLQAQFPAYSPDGQTIAFSAPLPLNATLSGIYTMPADGSAAPTLVVATGETAGNAPVDAQPSWSPDGRRLAFFDTGSNSPQSIWVVNADGSGLAHIWANDGRDPVWAPTNDKILFVSASGDGIRRLWTMDPDGSNAAALPNSPTDVFHPAYSPDGTKIVYQKFVVDSNAYELFTANADGSGETPLTTALSNNTDGQPDWGAAQASSVDEATANLTSDPTVEMSGSNDSIAGIPLSAFEPTGSATQTVNGAPINTLPINTLPINTLPINTLPINTLPMNTLPMNTLPINTLPINTLPLNTLPINTLGGWAAVLANTPLAGVPLQTVTLQQVLALNLPALAHLHLGDLDVSQSALGRVSLGALSLGSTPMNTLGFSSDQLSALTDWCNQVAVATADAGTPTTNCTSTTPLGARSLFELAIEGAPMNTLPINTLPINTLPMNTLPINTLPINTLDLSASPINTLPINTLPINTLGGTTPTPINTLSLSNILAAHTPSGDPSPFRAIHISALANQDTVVDCSASGLNCATDTLGDAADHNAIRSSARLFDILDAVGSLTLGDLHYYGNLTIGDLVASIPGTTPFGDILGLLIRRADVPWESLPPRALSAFDPNRPKLALTAHFTLSGSGTSDAVVTVQLPDGFDYVPGSATLSDSTTSDTPTPQEPTTIDGRTVEWDLTGVTVGDDYAIDFKAYSGTNVGAAEATEKVTSGTAASAPSIAAFSVGDSFEPNDASNALTDTQTLTPNDRVQQSAITAAGDVDYYRIPMPPAGTRINVHLANLTADYDLALYANQTTSVRVAANTGAPLQDGTVADQSIDLQGGTNPQLTPTALQDVPDPGVPVVQVSANRGTDDEDVGMISPGGGGYALIAVFGYNGASSPQPYSLRVTTTAPATITCDARTFPGGGTPGTASAVPSDVNTVFLVNEKRLGDTYGAQGESDVATALTRLAGERSLGISGAVLPVESIAGVQALYDQWDANPCDSNRANAIANAVADQVSSLKSSHPTLKYVVFVGGDDQVPYFRIPDLERIANEAGFAGQFANNEYYGALAGGNLLSDNPYLDTRPIPAGGRQLFIPDLVGGRVVEKPGEIVQAVTDYEQSHGKLDNSSAFVSGYDFVSDGSGQVASNLDAFLGANATRTLIGDTWSKSDLLEQAFPSGGPASINSWNGHYDNYEALAANGDHTNLLTTADLTGAHALGGGIFFTMGCHAGFQTTDAIVGATAPDALDWAEYFAGTGTGFVGNTGFGLGNTDSVAFSEELMSDFAQNLDGSMSIGDALTQAKADYYLGRTAFSSYDEKTLSEAELYGLPMYGVGTSPPALASTLSTPGPVRGTTSSTSPSDGSLSALTGAAGVQVANFDATPQFESTPVQGDHGQYFTNDGQVQAPNYRPLQPFVSLPATRTEAAHGVLVDSLTSNDVQHFDPDNVRPTLDQSANEPEPQFADEAWPEKVPTLVSLRDSNGLRQSLNLTTGQFFTDAATHDGVERQWTHIAGRVTYSSSNDFVPPTIDSIDAYIVNGAVTFTGRFSDLTETGAPGTVVVAQVVYDVDNGGHWQALTLEQDPTTSAWSGGAPFTGLHVQYFVEACDAAGNCGFSSNKGRYFDAQPLPPAPAGALTLVPRRAPDAGAFYNGPVTVDATDTAGSTVETSVDGAPYTNDTSVTVSGDGSHTIDARASDGTEAHTVVLVDATPPDATITVDPARVRQHASVHVTFDCTDRGSGVKDCSADQDGTPRQSGDALDTSAGGPTTFTVHVTDLVGNSQTITKTIDVEVNQPPTAPGAPVASASPSLGQFTLDWAASTDPNADPVTYTLQHKNAAGTGYTTVASGLTSPTYSFVTPPENEGTWTYQVVASDGELASPASAASAPVVVDQSSPNAPTLSAGRAPDFGTWFKDSVVVTTSDNSDATLADGSSGSGIDATKTTAPQTVTQNGRDQVTGAVTDRVGLSTSTTQEFDVDSLPPTVTVTCPAQPITIGTAAAAAWTAADNGSGIHGATSGTTALDTSAIGTFTATVGATDNVGHAGSGSCAYTVIWPFSGFFSPVDNVPTLNVLKPGQAVPVKFGLGGNRGLAIFAAGYPVVESILCASSAPTGLVDETVTAGNSSLSYDSGSNQYAYVWKTPSSGWASGACKQLVLKLADGTKHVANFKAK